MPMITSSAKKVALTVARIERLGWFVGKVFENASFLIPLKRRAEHAKAICIDHPVPVRPFHLLIVPKRRIASLFDLAKQGNEHWLDGILECIASALGNANDTFIVSSNGGDRQEVKQVHFHVMSRKTPSAPSSAAPPSHSVENDGGPKAPQSSGRTNSTPDPLEGTRHIRIEASAEIPDGVTANSGTDRAKLAWAICDAVRQHNETLRAAKGLTLFLEVSSHSGTVCWPTNFWFTVELPSPQMERVSKARSR